MKLEPRSYKIKERVPSGGTAGQVLTKTSDATAWQTPFDPTARIDVPSSYFTLGTDFTWNSFRGSYIQNNIWYLNVVINYTGAAWTFRSRKQGAFTATLPAGYAISISTAPVMLVADQGTGLTGVNMSGYMASGVRLDLYNNDSITPTRIYVYYVAPLTRV